ncbi:amidohydrolase [Saccharothrix sp. NRRL B-16348]|uniref:amidohydrolase family protein n=1 Tax=Saccharothrix sp. NRRL B-16348 TaxID=1415542 RepID=UPI0006AD9953|nr:amidohydrolase family protein [Saccharothrix sp. NRRL B-16348]KOX22521.1 amidohydrolase [Saccharothrix sp. NRRL B-16348]
MRTLIRDVRVFDGHRVVPRADVLIDGALIAEPGGRCDVEVDGRCRTLLPGLIDGHTHAFDGSLAQALAAGVTTELDMFCLPGNLARQRELAASRDDVADLRSAGLLATAPGGHPSQLLASIGDELGDAARPFETVADVAAARAFVAARVAEGVDYLKVVIDDGAVHGVDLPVLAPEVVEALVDAAHGHGLKVIAHAITAKEVGIAVDAGVDGLAHVWCDAGDDLVGWVAQRGVFVVSTLVYFESISGPTATVDHAAHGSFEHAVHAARVLHEAGVPIVAGTDANPWAPRHGVAMHRELALLTAAGLTPPEALAAATSVPAVHFGLTDRGRVEPGLRADLLLVDGDPTTDITATASVAAVWRRGVRSARP